MSALRALWFKCWAGVFGHRPFALLNRVPACVEHFVSFGASSRVASSEWVPYPPPAAHCAGTLG